MRTNHGVQIDGAITTGAKSFRFGWDHGELDAIAEGSFAEPSCEYPWRKLSQDSCFGGVVPPPLLRSQILENTGDGPQNLEPLELTAKILNPKDLARMIRIGKEPNPSDIRHGRA